jgi:hypothetical protein
MMYFGLQARVAFDLSPSGLRASAAGCQYCAIALEAIRQFEAQISDIATDVRWIYAYRPEERFQKTLILEVYFNDSRPKMKLEVYAKTPVGMLIQFSCLIPTE